MKRALIFWLAGFWFFVGAFVNGCAPRYTLSDVKERYIEVKSNSRFFAQVSGESGWEQELKGLLETYLKEKGFQLEVNKTDDDILVLTVVIKEAWGLEGWRKFIPAQSPFSKPKILTDVSLTRKGNMILEFTLLSKAPIYNIDVLVPRRSALLEAAAKEIVSELHKRLRK